MQSLPVINPNTGATVGSAGFDATPNTYIESAVFTDFTVHVTDRFDVQFDGRESRIEQQQNAPAVQGGLLFGPFLETQTPRMAVAHYQFEAIHPFTDGNGRTGRVLNLLFLVEQKILTQPVLYLSRYVIQNKGDYYKLLLGVTRDADWESWIQYMLRATEQTAKWTNDKIGELWQLIDHTAETVKRKLPSIYSRELIDALFVQPCCRIESLVDAGVAKRQPPQYI